MEKPPPSSRSRILDVSMLPSTGITGAGRASRRPSTSTSNRGPLRGPFRDPSRGLSREPSRGPSRTPPRGPSRARTVGAGAVDPDEASDDGLPPFFVGEDAVCSPLARGGGGGPQGSESHAVIPRVRKKKKKAFGVYGVLLWYPFYPRHPRNPLVSDECRARDQVYARGGLHPLFRRPGFSATRTSESVPQRQNDLGR